MKRKAQAHWQGTGKDGKGHLTTQSTVLNKTQYSFSSRFEEGIGTNPEELIAAAHSGCFTMKLAFNIQEANYTPKDLITDCQITLEDGAITNSHLTLKATVDGIGDEEFSKLVKNAEENCPISKLLDTKITVSYTLNQ
ncbi:osmotically inducible protein OsmC [Flavobacteriaceae bacterium MAR_2010_72]|nr:osmotically inducible protein OsmC [Flavobacteriaceae bacterium MAR_2010_72]TVZ58815.1 osmotically inducible protein OsmC [Flavobacteriaceae bacterium MAR_2010_105]